MVQVVNCLEICKANLTLWTKQTNKKKHLEMNLICRYFAGDQKITGGIWSPVLCYLLEEI